MERDLTITFFVGLLNWWNHLFPWLSTHGISIAIIVIFASVVKSFGARILMQVISHTVRKDLFPTQIDREKRIKTLNSLVHASLNLTVWIIATLLVISELKPSYAGPIFASAGAIGVAVGFGAQSLIKDFTSGIFIIIENQYRVGDVVSLNGVNGSVESISIRTTVLRDMNGHVHHIPNGTIVSTTNKTMDYGMINEDILVKSSTSVNELEKILLSIGEDLAKNKKYAKFILEPIHMLQINSYGPSGLEVKVVGRTTPNQLWEVKSAFYRELKQQFEKHDIAMPESSIIFNSTKK